MNSPLLIGFTTPAGFLLGLAAVPILVMFLLKRRYQERTIGSTMLWSSVLQDSLARSPFRRPSEWLSLLLLLLAVLAATLAAAGLRLSGLKGKNASVLVLDVSASMSTRDAEGRSRLEHARESVLAKVDSMRGGNVAVIVLAGAEPRVLCHASDDTDLLQRSLDDVLVESVEGDLPAALELAVQEGRGLRATFEETEIVVYSDFAMDPARLTEVAPGDLPIRLVSHGRDTPNAGIVHVSLSSGERQNLLLARVASNGADAGTRRLLFFREDQLVDAREVSFSVQQEVAEVIPVLLAEGEDCVRYRVELDPPDAMSLDDVAYLGVARNAPPRLLLVGEDDPFVTRLPNVFPDLVFDRVLPEELGSLGARLMRPFDLAVITEPPPTDSPIPAGREIWIGCAPPDSEVVLGKEVYQPTIVRWDRQHRLMRDIGFENLLLVQSNALELPDTAVPLAWTTAGVQLALWEDERKLRLIWGSELDASNLTLMPAFPLLVRNLLGSALGGLSGEGFRCADPLRMNAGLDRLQGNLEVEVTGPGGTTETRTLWAREDFNWQGSRNPGWYQVRSRSPERGMVLERSVGGNLWSASETTTHAAVPDSSAFASPTVESVHADALQVERPAWPLMVVICCVLLVLESLLRVGLAWWGSRNVVHARRLSLRR